MGIGFDWWQRQLGMVCFGYDVDGRYVATVGGIGMSIPRQVGKTYFVAAALVIMCILFPGLQVIWTAHHLRTSTKTFGTLRGLCRRKKVAPHIAIDGRGKPAIRTSNGEQEIKFKNGSVIMIGARGEGFGRGFDEVDVEVFDEAQILDTKSLEDMIAATNQARHVHGALLFFMGTPPRRTDPSEAFSLRRAQALDGGDDDAIWLELGADPESDPDDREQFPVMNPSYPTRTPLESLQRLRKNLGDEDSWNREGRGIWDVAASAGVIPLDAWMAQEDPTSVPVSDFAVGIEVGSDGTRSTVAVAGRRDDGTWQVSLEQNLPGSAWVAPYVGALVKANPEIRAVVVDVASPTQTVLADLKREGVRCTEITVKGLGQACSAVLSGVMGGTLWHLGDGVLSAAATTAGKRPLADTGMWVWNRRAATSDITPIQAITLALWGAQAETKNVKRAGMRRTSGGSVTVL